MTSTDRSDEADDPQPGRPSRARRAGLDPGPRLRPVGAVRPDRAEGDPVVAGLSAGQEQLWFLSGLAPAGPVYHELTSIEKLGPLDEAALGVAFNEILRRHEAWRTTFPAVDGVPSQAIHPPKPADLPRVDLSHLAPATAELRAAELIRDVSHLPYSIERGPLVRARLVRLGSERYRLYLAMHHLAFDGVSIYRVILPELIAIYDAVCAGRPMPLSEPTASYRAYAEAERTWLEGPRAKGRLDYWVAHLDGAEMLDVPLDRRRPAVPGYRGSTVSFSIPASTVTLLRSLAGEVEGSLFHVLATTFAVLLHRYAAQDDVVFATAADLRRRPEFRSVVGYCLTALVVRADCAGDPTFIDLLRRVRNDVLDGLDHLYPFDRLVRELHPARDRRTNPIFQAMIILEPPLTLEDPTWSSQGLIGTGAGGAKFDLELGLDERPDGHLAARLTYDSDLFDRSTAERMVDHWCRLVTGAAAEPQSPISALPLLSPAEEEQQLEQWNSTATAIPTQGVHGLVEQQAQRTPDAVALTYGDQQLSYAQLDVRANRLAHKLIGEGVRPGDLVAVGTTRSIDLVVALLAALKAGAAYLPLDPALPPDRLRSMLSDSAATTLIADASWPSSASTSAGRIVSSDPAASAGESGSAPSPSRHADGDDPCYVLYTSGSTGEPKGVVVRHRSVVNVILALARAIGVGADDTVLCLTTLSFDIAVIEVWMPLVVGAHVVVSPSGLGGDGAELTRLIDDFDVTFVQGTPTTWQALVDSGWTGRNGMKALSGGETLPSALAGALLRCGVILFNGYGPTETAVYSTMDRVAVAAPVSIGRPLANTRVYVVDRSGRSVPIGVAGELVIAGDGVGSGYHRRPALTAERFIDEPGAPGRSAYRSGDRVRWLPDGRLEHLGRLDDQVKLRGFRIEPGEIEAALLEDPDVTNAVVIIREDTPGDRRLVAYLTIGTDAIDDYSLRRRLRRHLPDHMIPSAFVTIGALPVTSRGKVNRAAFPPPPAPEAAQDRSAVRLSAVEHSLLEIWRRVLATGAVGADDSFFDVGGHSLLAVRLLAEVERRLGTRVTITTMIERAATVRDMAAVISEARSTVAAEPSVPASGRGHGPLFFIFPHDWGPSALRHFAPVFGATLPIVPLVIERLGWRFDVSSTVEQLAEPIFQALRRYQPEGPYLLCGFSFGGTLAYELARRAIAAGEVVEWLGLVDCPAPSVMAEEVGVDGSRLRRVIRGVRRDPRAVPSRARRFVSERQNDLRVRLGLPARLLYDGRGAAVLSSRYVCRDNGAPLTVFATGARVTSTALGWRSAHGGPVEVVAVPGTHETVLRQPDVEVLVERMASVLERQAGIPT